MTPEEKKKEHERLCVPYYSEQSGFHAIDCPIQQDIWKNPKRKNDYGVEFNHEN